MVALTSCGGGDGHNLNAVQLAELDTALVQAKSKENSDKSALATAIAGGADPSTIANLRALVDADEAALDELNAVLQIEALPRFDREATYFR